MRRIVVAGLVILGLLPAAPAAAQPVTVTILPPIDLAPHRFGTLEQFSEDTGLNIWCSIRTGGQLVLDNLHARTGGTEVAVGMARHHDPGTAPFPCPETWSKYYTGRVRFELPTAANRRLLWAQLRFTEIDRIDGVRPAGRCNGAVGAIGPITAPWLPGLLPGNAREGVPVAAVLPVPPRSTGVRTADITNMVQRWFEGSMPNHGLALIGVQDRVRARNATCATFVRNIRLIARWQPCPAGTRVGGRLCF
jgi:hypothetical protein